LKNSLNGQLKFSEEKPGEECERRDITFPRRERESGGD
jgi:hypothetical protein